jgi:hypothetical protein
MRIKYKIFVRKQEGKRSLRRPEYRWEGNIKMYFKSIGCEDMGWINLTQHGVQWWALVYMVKSRKFLACTHTHTHTHTRACTCTHTFCACMIFNNINENVYSLIC